MIHATGAGKAKPSRSAENKDGEEIHDHKMIA
jgi:hypothetical protein